MLVVSTAATRFGEILDQHEIAAKLIEHWIRIVLPSGKLRCDCPLSAKQLQSL
jgi:hypothetical protein